MVGGVLHIEKYDVEPARCGDLGVKLTHRAGGGVARIRQRRLAVYLALLIKLGKHGFGHIYLAADDEPLRRALYAQRERAHRAEVFRHVFSGYAVAARRAAHENAVFVLQRHRKPIDLRLNGVVMRARNKSIHPLAEGEKLIIRKNVRQALQRHLVRDRLKLAQHRAADALRRGVGGDKLRMGFLQRLEALHEQVILVVGYCGIIVHVVKPSVLFYLAAELYDLFLCVHSISLSYCIFR